MLKQLMTPAASACSVEHKTVVASDDPCTTCGFTAPSADYAICQARIAYGIQSGTAQYDRCVQNEFAARRPG
jgi:hypothetical protein